MEQTFKMFLKYVDSRDEYPELHKEFEDKFSTLWGKLVDEFEDHADGVYDIICYDLKQSLGDHFSSLSDLDFSFQKYGRIHPEEGRRCLKDHKKCTCYPIGFRVLILVQSNGQFIVECNMQFTQRMVQENKDLKFTVPAPSSVHWNILKPWDNHTTRTLVTDVISKLFL